ncbi:MAG TPA: DUF507 family protein [Thermodesulfovibrionales bacterium]|nr:DUF507 family protein [Thermodesulfovibrionales bacterium]
MTLSEEKISHLSHVLFSAMVEKGLIAAVVEEGKVRREIKRSLLAFLKISEDIDLAVRKKLQSFSRKIAEGSPEWEVLYKKFYREETARRGMASE